MHIKIDDIMQKNRDKIMKLIDEGLFMAITSERNKIIKEIEIILTMNHAELVNILTKPSTTNKENKS